MLQGSKYTSLVDSFYLEYAKYSTRWCSRKREPTDFIGLLPIK